MKEQDGAVTIWGIHPVSEFIKDFSSKCLEIFITEHFGRKRSQATLLRELERMGITPAKRQDFTSLSLPRGAVHQGVVALVRPVWEAGFEMLPSLWGTDIPLLTVCDQITDPRNLGAVIRSSVVFGAHALLLPERGTVPVTGVVVKASAGAIFRTRLCRVTNLARSMEALKKIGLWFVGLTPGAGERIWDMDLSIPLGLVVGAEGKGLRRLVRSKCDFFATIPQDSVLDSLNLSVALGVALYEVKRQRAFYRHPVEPGSKR